MSDHAMVPKPEEVHELPVGMPTVRIPQAGGAITAINFDKLSDADRMAIINAACNVSDENMDGAFGTFLPLTAAYVCGVDHVDENGEIKLRKKYVLLSSGKTYYGWSEQIASAICMLVAFYGTPPWNPEICVICDRGKNSKGQTFHYLRVVNNPNKKAKK